MAEDGKLKIDSMMVMISVSVRCRSKTLYIRRSFRSLWQKPNLQNEEPCRDAHQVGDEREVEVLRSFNWPPSELIIEDDVLPVRGLIMVGGRRVPVCSAVTERFIECSIVVKKRERLVAKFTEVTYEDEVRSRNVTSLQVGDSLIGCAD
ncbi:hypothetical protein Tco_0757804 [Tanacetum coccineum]